MQCCLAKAFTWMTQIRTRIRVCQRIMNTPARLPRNRYWKEQQDKCLRQNAVGGKRYFYRPILKLNPFRKSHYERQLRENLIFLLVNKKRGTYHTEMMSKQAYLSVEIITDNPTSGKISIPQLVSVAEQTGLYLTWSQPQYLCQHACVSTLHAN